MITVDELATSRVSLYGSILQTRRRRRQLLTQGIPSDHRLIRHHQRLETLLLNQIRRVEREIVEMIREEEDKRVRRFNRWLATLPLVLHIHICSPQSPVLTVT
jgi:hypothetical protein